MKPLTKVAAWVWMAMIVEGWVRPLYQRLHGVATGPAWTRSPVLLAFDGVAAVFVLLCAVALLRGRRWAWWVGVVLFGMSALGLPYNIAALFSGQYPRWTVWDNLAQGVAGLFILIAL